MADYIFSGVDKPNVLAALAKHGACGMVNALSAGQPKLRKAYERHHGFLALDSGAVQGNRNIKGYARLSLALGKHMGWIANLDAMHNQLASNQNYLLLKRLLAEDEEVSHKLLWIYQCQSRDDCWHPHGDLDALKRGVEAHSFVGIGGLVSVIERDILEAQDLLGSIGEVLDTADAQAHVFGLGNYGLLSFCLAHRWFRSADSARWLQGLRSRTLLTTDGKQLRAKNLLFSGMQCAEQNVRSMQTWMHMGKQARQLALFPEPDALPEASTILPLSWIA